MTRDEARSYVNWYIDTDVFEPHKIKPIHTKRYREALEVLRTNPRVYDPEFEMPTSYLEASEFIDYFYDYSFKTQYDYMRLIIAEEIIKNARENR